METVRNKFTLWRTEQSQIRIYEITFDPVISGDNREHFENSKYKLRALSDKHSLKSHFINVSILRFDSAPV